MIEYPLARLSLLALQLRQETATVDRVRVGQLDPGRFGQRRVEVGKVDQIVQLDFPRRGPWQETTSGTWVPISVMFALPPRMSRPFHRETIDWLVPLSAVNITIVFSLKPSASNLASIRPTSLSMYWTMATKLAFRPLAPRGGRLAE